MFFQTAFAFMIPEILIRLNQPYFDFKNIWPLNYNFFFDYNLNQFISSGSLGVFMLVWGILLIIVAVPLFSYFYGKRWYCSWVCGCGGLAETLGDPYRQLSDKSLKAWRIERWMIHGVLVFAVVMTAGVLYTYFTGSGSFLFIDTYSLRATYGFLIGAAFAGVVGVGFYPLMGNRAWCSGLNPGSGSRPTAGNAFPAATAPPTAKWASTCGGTPKGARTSFAPPA
jgi:polyferredoxin